MRTHNDLPKHSSRSSLEKQLVKQKRINQRLRLRHTLTSARRRMRYDQGKIASEVVGMIALIETREREKLERQANEK